MNLNLKTHKGPDLLRKTDLFFQANVFSQISKFFVISVQMTLIDLHTVRTLVRLLWERSDLGLHCLSKTVCLDS